MSKVQFNNQLKETNQEMSFVGKIKKFTIYAAAKVTHDMSKVATIGFGLSSAFMLSATTLYIPTMALLGYRFSTMEAADLALLNLIPMVAMGISAISSDIFGEIAKNNQL